MLYNARSTSVTNLIKFNNKWTRPSGLIIVQKGLIDYHVIDFDLLLLRIIIINFN